MGHARGYIEARRWSKGLLSFRVNGPRTREDNDGFGNNSRGAKPPQESFVEGWNLATSGMLYER